MRPIKTNRPTQKDHLRYLHQALDIAQQCENIEWYGVGCVIVNAEGVIISTGFTGEFTENGSMHHAEYVAITKALAAGINLAQPEVRLYSTLEPCSVRASGKTPCCQHIIAAGIQSVIYGAKEPFDPTLGIICEGDLILSRAGINVHFLKEMESLCLRSIVSKRKTSAP